MHRRLADFTVALIAAAPAFAQDPLPSYGLSCGTRLHGSDAWAHDKRHLSLKVVDAIPDSPVALLVGSQPTRIRIPGVSCPLLVMPSAHVTLLADRNGFAQLALVLPGNAVVNGFLQAVLFGRELTSVSASNGVQVETRLGLEGQCASTCTNSAQIIGCDNRVQGPDDAANVAPWNRVGRIGQVVGNAFNSKGTGTLIGDKYVLTAAHVVYPGGAFLTGPVGYRLAQSRDSCRFHPFGVRYVKRIFVPKVYTTSADAENKALDFAVLELQSPIAGGKTMDVKYIPFWDVKNRQPRAVGYPAELLPSGSAWKGLGSFAGAQPWLWLDNGAKGLLRVSNDGTGGMSGGPLFVWKSGRRKLVGVFIGSPIAECNQGYTWAARIIPATREHIVNAMDYPRTLDFFWRRKDYEGSEVKADVRGPCK